MGFRFFSCKVLFLYFNILVCLLHLASNIHVAKGLFHDCASAKEECEADPTCDIFLGFLFKTCGTSVTECRLDDRTKEARCRSAIEAMVSHKTFKGCSCNNQAQNYEECNLIKSQIFHNPCADNSESTLSAKTTPKPEESVTNDQFIIDCNLAKMRCLEKEYCHAILTEFERACPMRGSNCLATSRKDCLDSRTSLNNTVLGSCTCQGDFKGKRKCRRIYRMLYDNPCLSDLDLDGATTLSSDIAPTGGFNYGDSTCIQALSKCNSNRDCKNEMGYYINVCEPDKLDGSCDKKRCNAAFRKFIDTIPPEYTHALFFCDCHPDDDVCRAFRTHLIPFCSYEEIPIPSCNTLYQRCQSDSLCGNQLNNFMKMCQPDLTSATNCATNNHGKCRSAYINILGLPVLESCTCTNDDNSQCTNYQENIYENLCLDSSAKAYHTGGRKDTTSSQQRTTMVPSECQIWFDDKTPFIVTTGKTVRIPMREGCSEVCHCSSSGNLVNCNQLPCFEGSHCVHEGLKYNHSAAVPLGGRGKCTCFNGELICSQPNPSEISSHFKIGVKYLLIGYSENEEKKIENYVGENFNALAIKDKLQNLIENGCILNIVEEEGTEGNLMFSMEDEKGHIKEICLTTLASLCLKINDQKAKIRSDVVLSVLKVASIIRSPLENSERVILSPAEACLEDDVGIILQSTNSPIAASNAIKPHSSAKLLTPLLLLLLLTKA